MTTPEQWRNIVQWPGYEVSDLGRVRRGERILRTFLRKGYPSFNATHGKERRALKVHIEVASAFLPRPAGTVLVRHLDGMKTNVTLSNLAWGTVAENSADAIKHGHQPRGEKHGNRKLTEDDVRALRRLPGRPPKLLLEQLNIHPTTALRIQRGILWKHLV